jgi:hypothetical protein
LTRRDPEELKDGRKEMPEPEMSDAAKERLAELGQRANNSEQQIAQQQSAERRGGRQRFR